MVSDSKEEEPRKIQKEVAKDKDATTNFFVGFPFARREPIGMDQLHLLLRALP